MHLGLSLVSDDGEKGWSLKGMDPAVLAWAYELKPNTVTPASGSVMNDWAEVRSDVDHLVGGVGTSPTYQAAQFGGRARLLSKGVGYLRGTVTKAATHIFAVGSYYYGGSPVAFPSNNGLVTLNNNGTGIILSGEPTGFFSNYLGNDAYYLDGVSISPAAAVPGQEGVAHLYEVVKDAGISGGAVVALMDRQTTDRYWPGAILATIGLYNPSPSDVTSVRAYLQSYLCGSLVVATGDSITQGVRSVTPNLRWSTLVREAWGNTVDFANIALSGQGIGTFAGPTATSSMLDGDPAKLAIPVFNVRNRRRKVLVVFAGTNDLALGRTAAQLKADIATYCTARKAEGWKVVLVTIIDRQDLGGGQAAFDADRDDLNDFIINDTSSYADAVVDLTVESALNDVGAALNATNYLDDFVHLSATGESLVSGYIRTVLENVLTA